MSAMHRNELLAYLQSDVTVVAVNRRLARRLVLEYDSEQRNRGCTVWRRPPVYTYENWLREAAAGLGTAEAVLSSAQTQQVWESILQDDIQSTGQALLQVPQTAKKAVAAAQLLHRYETTFSAETAAADHQSFLRWLTRWQQQAARHGWLLAGQLPGLIADAVTDGRVSIPGSIVFAGFDKPPPSDRRLRAAMQNHGCAVVDWQPVPADQSAPATVMAHDMEDEVRRAARWAAAITKVDSDRRIAVVAPQLEQYLSLIQTAFLAEIDPASMVAGETHSPRINISLGERLDRLPVVRIILRLLTTGFQINSNDLGLLLRSPYLAGAMAEQHERALADRILREKRIVTWTIARLEKNLEPLNIPIFCTLLKTIMQRQPESQCCQPGDWAEIFQAEIVKLGWPGDRTLESNDYQAVKRFVQTLEQLATLDRVSGPINRSAALKLLRQLVADSIFQPESGPGGIEVLGLLETAGQTFDHLWVLGLHDVAIPPPPQPNPFIPLPLQRHLGMPHADADRELDFAQTVASHLFFAAPEVILSWPQAIDGAPCRPSPLLRGYAAADLVLPDSVDPARTIRSLRPGLASIDDSRAAPIHTLKAVSGGTGIIKDQALCPFRAFAHHRLRADGLDRPDLGLDGMARGTLIHTVLELFWLEVETRQNLLTLDANGLSQLLGKTVAQAIQRFERQRRHDLTPRQRRLETGRLLRLAQKWLDIDRQRPPFRARVEEHHTEQVGQLLLRTRIDRIDELETGRVAIIDFKSGNNVDHKQWLEQRLTEPQLPLYCLNLDPDTVEAVLFAQLRGNDQTCRFLGLARQPDDWPGLKSSTQEKLLAEKGMADFDAALLHWRKVLPELGDAFVAGDIAVAPVHADSCRYCDVRPLCRIDMAGEGGGDD